MIVSPTEPRVLLDRARAVSMAPEHFGADILLPIVDGKWAGVQRKELRDLIASISDGRLNEQIVKMRTLPVRMLVVEGQPKWSESGELLGHKHGPPLTRDRFDGVLWRAQADGMWVTFTAHLAETVTVLEHFGKWVEKSREEFATREPVASSWGKPDSRDFQRHLLMGLPNVGPKLADVILDAHGMPWEWRIDAEDLAALPGIGAKKAAQIIGALSVGAASGGRA